MFFSPERVLKTLEEILSFNVYISKTYENVFWVTAIAYASLTRTTLVEKLTHFWSGHDGAWERK